MTYRRPSPTVPAVAPRRPVFALNTPTGPCARCRQPHHRYGPGGQPLCPTCRPPAAKPSAA